MKTKHISIRMLMLLLALLLALVACGGSEPAAETPAAEEPATEEPAAGEPAAGEPAAEEPAAEEPAPAEDFTIGLIMVGPRDDHGWNEAHYVAIERVAEALDANFIWFDKLNVADNPDVTVEQVVDDFVAQGADFIITNSAEFGDPTDNAARAHPDVEFIHASGDNVLDGTAPPNVSNLMGEMEYGKMIAGCAAAMATQTGRIAYLGPLIDPETRRLVNSTYLGARYCYENERGLNADDLQFDVVWIGFWFNIPGVTLDPTQVVNDFIDSGADVVLSGIDTTEAIVVAGQRTAAGTPVFAVPYDYEAACDVAPEVCLGVPYYNWKPDYLRLAESSKNGSWEQQWLWTGPDWNNINDHETSMIGWLNGPGLDADGQAALDRFIAGLADGSINLWAGPLLYQDGSEFVTAGATATPEQIWYTAQLLQGITGASE